MDNVELYLIHSYELALHEGKVELQNWYWEALSFYNQLHEEISG